MGAFESITAAARRWADEEFRPAALTARPNRNLIVLACMDARLDLFRMLGLDLGDAHILRNAAGRATDDALRSITVSSVALDTREVLVIHHTECGLGGITDEEVRAQVHTRTGRDPADLPFLAFSDLEESVRDDVARIRSWPYLPPGMTVWGAYYDVATGELVTVVPPTPADAGPEA